MTRMNGSEVRRNVEQADDGFYRAGDSFICGLDEWIEWRARKLQGVRREIVEKTRLTRKPSFGNRARAASRG